MEFIRFYNLHAPDDVRVFSVPMSGISRRDAIALVYDARVGSGSDRDLILRHYSFSDRWFEVNCTFDLSGRFVTEQGPIRWCFNCDICTPHFSIGSNYYNVDLCLDVLAAPDGRHHVVIDREEFADAAQQGFFTCAEIEGAQSGLTALLDIIETISLTTFLDDVCPFDSIRVGKPPPPVVKRRLSDIPVLRPDIRENYVRRPVSADEISGVAELSR